MNTLYMFHTFLTLLISRPKNKPAVITKLNILYHDANRLGKLTIFILGPVYLVQTSLPRYNEYTWLYQGQTIVWPRQTECLLVWVRYMYL